MGGVLFPYGYVVTMVVLERVFWVGGVEMWKRCYEYGDFSDAGSTSKMTSWPALLWLLLRMATEGRRVLGLNNIARRDFMNV